jgi:hypothetical protein
MRKHPKVIKNEAQKKFSFLSVITPEVLNNWKFAGTRSYSIPQRLYVNILICSTFNIKIKSLPQ